MKFSELVKYKHDTDLLISKRHDAWMRENSNPVYSEQALEFAREALAAQARPRDRRGTISSSSLGTCWRKQQFTFLGVPEEPPPPKLAGIFQNGTFMHIRWQMAGLTEGWLQAVEVPVGDNPYRLSGTMDGIAYEDSVVEFKSCNSNAFRQVLSFGPQHGHEYQLGTYLLTSGRNKGVFVYEDKNTQEYTEIVRDIEQLPLDEVAAGASEIWEKIDNQVLAEPLDECLAKSGKYNTCPFRKVCLPIMEWEDADHAAHES